MTDLLIYSGILFLLLGLTAHLIGLILPRRIFLKSSFISNSFQVEYIPVLYELNGWKKWFFPEQTDVSMEKTESELNISLAGTAYSFSIEQFLVGKKIELKNAVYTENKYGAILWSFSLETKKTEKGVEILITEQILSESSLQNILMNYQYKSKFKTDHHNRISALKSLLG